MIQRRILFFCFLVAALGCSEGSFVDFFSRRSLGPLEGSLGPSFPGDTVYVPFKTCRNHFMLTRAGGGTVQAASFAECQAAAASKGAHAFWYVRGVCEVATLRYPLCFTRAKNFNFFVQEEYLSNGTSTDDAFITPDVVSDLLNTTSHRSFRIESPTIMEARKFRKLLSGFEAADNAHANNFILLRDNGGQIAVDEHIMADPACYTNSTCGVPFFTSAGGDEESNARTLFLHDVCSERIHVKRGQVYHLLSHAGIGCKPYPSPYPAPYCSVLFRGFGKNGPLKAKVTLVDFKGNDRCGGQSLRFVTFEKHGAPKVNRFNVCRSPVEEITTQEGRIRIALSGSETRQRRKYGFIIKISY